MRRASNYLLFVGIFMLFAVGISSLVVRTANAATWQAPMKYDNAGVEYIRNGSSAAYGDSYPNASRQMEYVVSYDDFTDIFQTDILVYMPTKYGTIQIVNKDLCTNTTLSVPNSDSNYVNEPQGTRMTTYQLMHNNTFLQTGYGYWDYSGPGACANNTLNMTADAGNASGVQVDPDTGMYVYRIRANAVTSGAGGKFSNGFHIIAPAGSYISQDSNNAASSFGMQPSYPIPGQNPANDPTPPDPYRVYTDLDVPFGPDCSLLPGQTTTKTFDIYDVDYGNYDVQPQPFHVQVLKYNRATGALVGNGTTPLSLVSGSASQQLPITSNIWRPTGANQTTTRFAFTANGNEIYKLRIYNLYYDNTLQFKIPYNSVWFFKQCQTNIPRHIRAVTSMTPNPAENGQTLTGTTSIVNSSNNSFDSTVDFTRRVWADANRNGVYDPGETTLLGPQSGTTFVPPSPGTRPVVPDWTAVADSAIMGGRVCIALGISADPPVVVDAPAISISCADIGKKPKVQVAGGDVFAGGTFRNGAGTCPIQATPPLGIVASTTVIGGTTYSSFTQYGALSLGLISLFGTNNAPPGYPFANMLSFGNTTNLGYFYSAGRGAPTAGNPLQARCLNDPFAVYSPKASATSGASNVDVSAAASSLKMTASGTITVSAGSAIPASKRLVIYAPNASTVVINSDITYADGPYSSIDQIPQLVVLTNGNITVNAGVKRIDGIYAAKGNFTTCEVQPQLDTCTNALEVNGMVVAGGTVKPFRTAGATSADYFERAEVFRLHPDAFLNQAGGSTDDIIRTVDQREAPPRF